MNLQRFVSDLVTFWVVIDPFAVLPVFLVLTIECQPGERRRLAVQSILVALGVIVFFIALGQILVEAIGLSLRAFQIAGGIVLFLFATSLVLGEATVRQPAAGKAGELAVFPLAIPAIAGPGTMLTAMLLTDNDRFGVIEQAQTAVSAAAVLAVTLGMLFGADPIVRAIGAGGANVLKRIMGMVLATIAVNAVLAGLAGWLGLPKL